MNSCSRIGYGVRGLAVFAGLSSLSPQATASDLPLEPSSDMPELLSDFVAACSRAVVEPPQGGIEATERGWVSVPGTGPLEGLDAIGVAMLFGQLSFEKDFNDSQAFMTISSVRFPHVVATTCQINVLDGELDPLPLDTVTELTGVEGAGRQIEGLGFGFWSLLDSDDVVTTIAITQPENFLTMSMNRGVRTALGN